MSIAENMLALIALNQSSWRQRVVHENVGLRACRQQGIASRILRDIGDHGRNRALRRFTQFRCSLNEGRFRTCRDEYVDAFLCEGGGAGLAESAAGAAHDCRSSRDTEVHCSPASVNL
jgi:hypothetical protein